MLRTERRGRALSRDLRLPPVALRRCVCRPRSIRNTSIGVAEVSAGFSGDPHFLAFTTTASGEKGYDGTATLLLDALHPITICGDVRFAGLPTIDPVCTLKRGALTCADRKRR